MAGLTGLFMGKIHHFEVIVVGVGAMGSSTCFELARRGVKVLGIEQFDIPHTLGSYHGFSRMIRLAYHEHPDYVPLLKRAYEKWDEIEKVSGNKLLYVTGGVYMGWRDGELVSGALRASQLHHLEHDLIGRDELSSRYPQFELPDDHVALLEPRAGFLLSERATETYARQAQANGAEIHTREIVESWSTSNAGVTVKTNRAEYHGDQIIFCGGAWSEKLTRDLGVKLVVTRQVLGWVVPPEPALFEMGKLPVWAIEHPAGGLWYGFPMMAESHGFKIALHAKGEETDADRVNRNPTSADEETFRSCLSQFIPRAGGPVNQMRICLYTNSPDSHFMIDRHPHQPRVLVACGFSGHGFKFASVVGEILADMATKGKTDLPCEFISLARFHTAKGDVSL
ncbi:MAG TPA: N-methyl-L-tryptophan oxidase [Tepidisphaeraceae bacterium]|jgi:sarcosine oxidase|nr:N-methyl-L-tryptophan oxidase [Tepidisphaeraceae bacterium]